MNSRILAAPALALLLGACTVDNNASLAWGPICFPSDDCTFESTCGAQYIGPYLVDPANGLLELFVQVNNQRADNADETTGNVNTATAYIREYEIEFLGGGLTTTAIPVAFTVPASGTAVVWLPVPFPTGMANAQVTARVKAKGVYGDEREFETAALEIPISVCTGCGTTCATTGCPVSAGQSPIACGT